MARSMALQPEDVRALLAAQLAVTVLLAGALLVAGRPAAAQGAAFGGGTALLSAGVLGLTVRGAARRAKRSPGSEMVVLYVGAVLRFVAVLVLFAVGMGVLKLPPVAILAGFAAAQLGFLFNSLRVRSRASRDLEKLG